MEQALTIERKRRRISLGDVECCNCPRLIDYGHTFTTIKGRHWCDRCLDRRDDWKAWTWVLTAVGVVLLLFLNTVAG